MTSPKLLKALNDQIVNEFYSAYLYLSMEAYFSSLNLNGFANWFRVQAQEERDHAMLFFTYINKIGGRVELGAIDKPDWDFKSIGEVLQLSLSHEQKVTQMIYNISYIASEEKDLKTQMFVQWFVNEQVEEESNADGNVKKYKFVENDGRGILMMDADMATRTYTAPTGTTIDSATTATTA